MKDTFEIAGGSIVGRDHIQTSKNNQDAFYFEVNEDYCLGIVADGCGSAQHSEVGAQMGVRTLASSIKNIYRRLNKEEEDGSEIELFFNLIQNNLVSQIENSALFMSPSPEKKTEIIYDYFLFTILGFLIYKNKIHYFWAGDGIIIKHGEILGTQELIINQNNEPKYIAYNLTGAQQKYKSKLEYRTAILTDDLQAVLIGCDGVKDLCESADKTIPGKTELIGSISQFWTEDKYFKNRFLIERRLRLANTPKQKRDDEGNVYMENGRLPDDTTLIVCRRKNNE